MEENLQIKENEVIAENTQLETNTENVVENNDSEEKKEYNGCLSFLLPLSIFGNFIQILYNIMIGIAASEYDSFLVPAILITLNAVGIIALILLMKFNRLGLYLFIFAQIIFFIVAFCAPDQIEASSIGKVIFGTGLLLILLAVNKNGKSGYDHLYNR